MASGAYVGRIKNSTSKGSFDFVSDDVFCLYEGYGCQKTSNENHSDPVLGANPNKDFHKSIVSRSSVFPTAQAYTQPEDPPSEEMIIAVERTMKKYTDNLMRFLDGISSRLTQLELYCYNIDKSIGKMRSELGHDHGETDAKLKSLDKHLQEVHRSVQILKDKQELAETQKELAKLQLARKESSPSEQEEKVATPLSATKKTEDLPEIHNQQLALALPSQVAPPVSFPVTAQEQQQLPLHIPSQTMTSQQSPYYLPAIQWTNPAAQPQPSHGHHLPADSQYRASLGQNPSQGQVNESTKLQQFPQYQQHWSQPQPPVQPAQPQLVQSQAQTSAPPSPLYAAYIPSQPTNPSQEARTSSVPMQVPLPGIPHQGVSHAEVLAYGYGVSGRPLQTQSPPQHMKGGDGYPALGTHPPLSSGGSYVIYDCERTTHSHQSPPIHFSQAGYHPTNMPFGNPSQFVQNPPYCELIDKLASMGYRDDHVASIIQRLENTGQPVDFNAVLDKLNGHSSGGPQRSW